MSGTSADGVDVAAVEITGRGLRMKARLLGMNRRSFPSALRRMILDTRNAGRCELAELARMGERITLAYAQTALQLLDRLQLEPHEIACIAAHGQTLFHSPPLTIQWFDPALLAAKTGCDVVSDFRRADCALGGQGAPLVPFADCILFRHPRRSRVLLNIGGIANITWLPAGGDLNDIIAFDTGPGNCLSDAIAQEKLNRQFDAGGKLASQGMANEAIVDAFLRDRYFRLEYPKSTDGPAMLSAFKRAIAGRSCSTQDLLATACLCCARAIARGIGQLPGRPGEIIAAGGGTSNRAIIQMLERETGLPIRRTDELAVPVAAREAMAFALLAAATLDGIPANVPSVTGAIRPAILGSITKTS